MKQLIADGGSSKIDWVIVENGIIIKRFASKGWNPYYLSAAEMIADAESSSFESERAIDEIFFYGSGCSSPEKKSVVRQALAIIYPESKKISVNHDLLGAARAVCQSEQGIALILGTGSHACFFDGKEIRKEITNLGFWLGDEGSGAVIGRKLVVDYLYGRMPSDIQKLFDESYDVDRDKVLHQVHQLPKPNEYFASFMPFLKNNIQSSYCSDLVKAAFEEFLGRINSDLGHLQGKSLFAVGSVAYYFKELLAAKIQERGASLEKVIQKPIDGLINYHREGRI